MENLYSDRRHARKKDCQYKLLGMIKEGNCLGEYLRKSIGTSRQNARKHLIKLEKKGFIQITWRDRENIEYGITPKGDKVYRVYAALVTRKNRSNRKILSRYDCKNKLFGKDRYHNFKIVAMVGRVYPNGFRSVGEVVVSSSTMISNFDFSTFDRNEVGEAFELIDSKINDYCKVHDLEVLSRKCLVDVAQIRRKKEMLEEFDQYSDWTYDNSLGFPERETTFEVSNGELRRICHG